VPRRPASDFWERPGKVERLVFLWYQEPRVSTQQIADQLGCSKNSVVSKAHRLKLPSRGNPVDESRKIADMKRAKAIADAATTRLNNPNARPLPPGARTLPPLISEGGSAW